jgi:ABC-type multidrug transport system ATPase subunit
MWDVINADLPGRTVIFTSHNFERALAACDEVLIIARGRVAFSSSSRGMGLTGLQETYRQCTGAAR